MTDWEKRAREELSAAGLSVFGKGPWEKESYWAKSLTEIMTRIGREMADERAEEIAQRLETALMGDLECSPGSFGRDAACIARSTISKPEPLPGVDRERFMHGQFPKGVTRAEGSPGLDESRIRADEREKIAAEIDESDMDSRYICESDDFKDGWAAGQNQAAAHARGKKTREQVLEEALRSADKALSDVGYNTTAPVRETVRRALEWKP